VVIEIVFLVTEPPECCPIYEQSKISGDSMRLNWKITSLLAASLFGSFFITLWLTVPAPNLPPPGGSVFRPDALQDISATSNADLLKNLLGSGFRENSDIIGRIDQFKKQPDRSVRIDGWAVDQYGAGKPLTVSVFVDGETRLTVTTAGPREDVAKGLNLAENTTRNIGFSGTFICETTAHAMVLAINAADGRYGQLDQRRCPFTLF
jgi:hypothetical protein